MLAAPRLVHGPLRTARAAMVILCLLPATQHAWAQGVPDDLSAACLQDLRTRLGGDAQPRVDGSWPATWPDACLGIACAHTPEEDEATAGWTVLASVGGAEYEYHAAAGVPPRYAGHYSEPPLRDFQEVVREDTAFSGLRVTLVGMVGALRDGPLLVEAPVKGLGDLAQRPNRVLVRGPIEPHLAAQVPATALTWGRVVGTFESRASRPEGKQFGRYGNYPYQIEATRFVPEPAPGVVPGCFGLDTLAARADELHLKTVVVRGSYRTHFEYNGLVPGPGHPANATCWLAGDLSGIATPIQAFGQATAPVEVLGVFERCRDFTGRNGYGHLGTDRFQITVTLGHLIASELNCADVLANPTGYVGALVVRGVLASTADGYVLGRAGEGASGQTCLLAGDLSWMDRFAGSFSLPCPVLVQGTLEARRGFDGTNGFGDSRSRPLRLTAVFIRPLWEEMPTAEGGTG